MLTIEYLANWFLEKESMEHHKLQMLCYYAVAWHYAFHESQLVENDEFQAWVHRPMSPVLYEKYNQYGFNPIPKQKTITDFGKATERFLEMIYSWYKEYNARKLEMAAHYEEPWAKARGDLKQIEAGYAPISPKDMKEYYFNEYVHAYKNEYLFATVLKRLGMESPEDSKDHPKYHFVFYLLQEFGMSMGYRYEWGRGPYSPQLEHCLRHTSSLIHETASRMTIKNEYEVFTRVDDFKEKILKEYITDPLKLETLASMHYINLSSFSGKASLKELRARLFDTRPSLKEKEHINVISEQAYSNIQSHLQ